MQFSKCLPTGPFILTPSIMLTYNSEHQGGEANNTIFKVFGTTETAIKPVTFGNEADNLPLHNRGDTKPREQRILAM